MEHWWYCIFSTRFHISIFPYIFIWQNHTTSSQDLNPHNNILKSNMRAKVLHPLHPPWKKLRFYLDGEYVSRCRCFDYVVAMAAVVRSMWEERREEHNVLSFLMHTIVSHTQRASYKWGADIWNATADQIKPVSRDIKAHDTLDSTLASLLMFIIFYVYIYIHTVWRGRVV